MAACRYIMLVFCKLLDTLSFALFEFGDKRIRNFGWFYISLGAESHFSASAFISIPSGELLHSDFTVRRIGRNLSSYPNRIRRHLQTENFAKPARARRHWCNRGLRGKRLRRWRSICGIGNHHMVAEELGDILYIRCLTATGVMLPRTEERLAELRCLHIALGVERSLVATLLLR